MSHVVKIIYINNQLFKKVQLAFFNDYFNIIRWFIEMEGYSNKWYVREDFRPEPFKITWDPEFCKQMQQIGNCFDTREGGMSMSN